MAKYIQVVTTIENSEQAQKLGRDLVEKRLAACAQVDGPINSVYWWQGRVEEAQEWRLTLKTVRAHYDRLEEEILRLHPYTTPEILATPIEAGSADYLDWLQREVD